MILISCDIGKTMGISVLDDKDLIYCTEAKPDFVQFESLLKDLIDLYKPKVILYGAPTRFYNVIRLHFQYIGILNLLAQKNDIQTVEVIDSRAKKEVLGKGKATKEEIIAFIHNLYPKVKESEHVMDSLMFALYYLSSVK